METFSALLALCTGNSPHKGQWRGALMFSLIYAWINDWVNNREAGDLRRQRDHYDVIVMNIQNQNHKNAWYILHYLCNSNLLRVMMNHARNLFISASTFNNSSGNQLWYVVVAWYWWIEVRVMLVAWQHQANTWNNHYGDVMMSAMASQITSPTTVYLIVCSGANQRKYQSSTSMAFLRGIHRWSVNSLHKGLVTQKMFPFDDVIMMSASFQRDPLEFISRQCLLEYSRYRSPSCVWN